MNQRELFLRHVAQTSEFPLLGVDVNIREARGCKLVDENGKVYTDLISGISVSNIGHCHPRVLDAVQAQSSKFMHLMVYGEFNQQPQVQYAKTLTSLLPSQLDCVYFTTGGSESVEGAMKLAKRYTGRSQLVSFKNSYHGSTQGALSLMGDEYFKNAYRPLLPDVLQINFNRHEELVQITEQTAAVFVEPIQGEAGVIKADKGFLKALSERCSNVGALLVFDEIQTGFGRTGTLFAFEQYGIVPDVLLIAKAMGGGLPIGAFVSSVKILSSLSKDPVLGHINTFGGNAVCVAAAQACLDVIVEDKLFERAKEIEKQIRSKLNHTLIRQLRVHGALGAIEFANEATNLKVLKTCLDKGLISDWFLFAPQCMRIAPPLTISDQELNEALEQLMQAIQLASQS